MSSPARLGVWIPGALLHDTRIGPTAKYLYMLVCLIRPGCISELCRVSGLSRESVRGHCRALAEAGWVIVAAKHGRKTIVATAPRPTQEALASRLKDDRWESAYAGEFLMKAWLDLLIDSDDFVDNSRPSFLAHPVSGQLLEYDRYYREGVAFEYNGRQHYETTPQFPDEAGLQDVQVRDHIKSSLSHRNGVVLVVITEDDLTLDRMRDSIPDTLPVREIDEKGPYARMLANLSDEYINNCRRLRSRERRKA